jgi:hypothetical protein
MGLALAGLVLVLGAAPASAQSFGGMGGGPGGPGGPRRPPRDEPKRPKEEEKFTLAERPPHRGQLSSTGSFYFEVVYRSWETRIYVYDRFERPLSTRLLQAHAWLKTPDSASPVSVVFEHVPQPGDLTEQDYLAAVVDISQLVRARGQATIQVQRLPSSELPQALFNQPLVLSPLVMSMIPGPLTETDEAAIARQRTCPVSGLELGSHGPPIKVFVGNQVVYLCYRGLIPRFESRPDSYMARLSAIPTPGGIR